MSGKWDDVALEQMIESEHKINLFFKKNNIEAGTSIERVAEILNIKQGGTEQGIRSQAYLKEDSNTEKKIVVFKEGLTENEKHLYLHTK